MKNNSFNARVYEALKKVPKGRVTTYKEIGRYVSSKGYRAIGNVLNKNPNSPIVPCHRVVNSDARIGGFAFGIDKKIKLLAEEGVEVRNMKIIDFERKFFRFE